MSHFERRSGLAVLTVAVLLIGSAAAQAATTKKAFTAKELSARAKVLGQIAAGAPYELNLGDDDQYNFVLATLRLHGDSPEESPALYRALAAEHAKHKGGPPVMATGVAHAVGNSEPDPAVTTNMIQYLWNDSQRGVVDTSLLSSAVQGSTSTTMVTNFTVLGASQPFAASPIFEQAGGGKNFVVPYEAALPAQIRSSIDSSTIVQNALFVVTKNGVTTPFTMTVNGTVAATCQCVTAPNYKLNQQFPPCPTPVGGTAQAACSTDSKICINKGDISAVIESCYGRNDGNCNYGWGGSGYPPNITLQVSGSMAFPSPVATALQGFYLLNLQNISYGGGCYLPSGGGSPAAVTAANFWIDPANANQLDYCFQSQQFPNNQCLTQARTNVNVTLELYILLANGAYGNATVSSAPDTWHEPWYAQIPVIEILQGCLLEGTQVEMADGTMKAIETFRGNGTEIIVSNREGDLRPVTGTMSGVEDHPMYRVTTGNGMTVTMTAEHPVPTPKGVTTAAALKVGTTVFTRKGPSTIAKIERTKPGLKVWNLKIGTQQEAQSEQATFFADGVLSGDYTMQKMLAEKQLRLGMSKAEVLARLPAEWRQDYLNYLKKHPEQQ